MSIGKHGSLTSIAFNTGTILMGSRIVSEIQNMTPAKLDNGGSLVYKADIVAIIKEVMNGRPE
jgi:hypothetical protein